MELDEPRNGTVEITDDDYTNVYFIVGDRMETASFRSDHVTNKELKELFRSAAEAGPLDIVKLRKGDKLLNISPQLPSNTLDTPYLLQVVGAHPASSGMIEADLLRALERRVAALERELREHQEAASSEPSIALGDLKRQMDAFKSKLETTEHLSWLGFYKQLPEPVSSEACRRLQYRRKSDSVKRRVREKFLNICDVAVSSGVREWLRSPAFDARQWEDEELLLMLQTMFVELELLEKFDISLSRLGNFLYEVYNNYNEVPFHNFRHCFCVAQMMYAIAWAVDLPSKIGHLEVFVLIVSCICHDLDHPGYNNIYQINARTELALRYNDISPLENHHCSVAFRVLESPECNILASLDAATYRIVREGIIRCILATDMARHNEILGQFTDTVPEFDYENKSHINLLSMVLIKVADISNEARPMDVAEPWLDRLLQEFFKQSDAEKLEGLPVTPFMDRDKVTKPSSQCSFIGFVLLPLFESLGELLPELQELIVQPVHFALEYYRRLNEAAKDERHHRKSVVDLGESGGSTGGTAGPVTKSTSSHSMRSKRSVGTVHSTDEDHENPAIDENLESSDPETATEVEISEKTLKFKISTGSATGRKSYPGSRKGSREKSDNHDLVKAVRDNERRRSSRGDNFSSDMSSPVSAKSVDDGRIIEEFERDDEKSPLKKIVGGKANDGHDYSANVDSVIRCCCDEKTTANKSLLSRWRNFTDRLSISFDTRETPMAKPSKHRADPKIRSEMRSETSSCRASNENSTIASDIFCKRCNLMKLGRDDGIPTSIAESIGRVEKRAMTLPKVRKSQDSKNKSWRIIFAKEKRPSVSLETLPAHDELTKASKHRRNLSNPEDVNNEKIRNFHDFKGIDVRKMRKPEIIVQAGSSVGENRDDIGKIEIRRSSASMEDISNITKQNEDIGGLEEKKSDEMHTGSLDSMLYKESSKRAKKSFGFPSPYSGKKSSAGLFSRLKSGMSIDGTRSGSVLNDQQTGWISSLTASFRPKRQSGETLSSPGHEGVK